VVPLAGRSVELTAVIPVPDPTDPAPPLVVALHYAGGRGVPHYATGFVTDLVGPGLADLGAIVVAPDCPGPSWTDPTSEPVVLALVDYAVKTWHADPKRVVVTGYSMGGVGAWFYAAHHPDVFAAAVPVASAPTPVDRVPVYAIQGRRDEVFAVAPVEQAVAALVARGVPAELHLVDRSHYQVPLYRDALAAAVPWLRERLSR
jgi:predicted peptidase